jgi:opacity protein-like surface antigen
MRALRSILSIGLLVVGTSAMAQGTFFILRYQAGVPIGEFRDYIQKTSWRGFNMGFRSVPSSGFAVGFDMAWQGFEERKAFDTYTFGTASVSGVQFRYQNTFQFSGQAEYFLTEGSDLMPYVSMGAGAIRVRRTTQFGLFEVNEDPWQFMLKPGIGFTYYLSQNAELLLGMDYVVGFRARDLEGQSYLGFNIGFVFRTS